MTDGGIGDATAYTAWEAAFPTPTEEMDTKSEAQ